MTGKLDRRKFLAGGAAAVAATALSVGAYGSVIETHHLTTTTANFGNLLGVGLRIAQISDLHLRSITSVHEKLAEALADIRADVLIISGDTIDERPGYRVLPDLLRMLPAHKHAFATLGNWEHYVDATPARLDPIYARAGVDLLVNRRVRLRGRNGELEVIGMDDSTAGTPDMREAWRGDHPTVCIAHSPAFRDITIASARAPEMLPELMISGHTHGGQVTLAGWAPYLPIGSGRYQYGWYRGQKPWLYVSRGIGTTFFPIRLGAVPEVVVYDL